MTFPGRYSNTAVFIRRCGTARIASERSILSGLKKTRRNILFTPVIMHLPENRHIFKCITMRAQAIFLRHRSPQISYGLSLDFCGLWAGEPAPYMCLREGTKPLSGLGARSKAPPPPKHPPKPRRRLLLLLAKRLLLYMWFDSLSRK